jgi:hypothetical protein
MSALDLISRLDGVVDKGAAGWRAQCPAHGSKGPSLWVTDHDGVVGVHCFAGCSVEQVLSAVGMEMDDLFPPRPKDPAEVGKPIRRSIPAQSVLESVAGEALIVALVAQDVFDGKRVAETDRKRVWTALQRLNAAVEVARGR